MSLQPLNNDLAALASGCFYQEHRMGSEDKFVERLAKRHSFSTTAVQAVLVALRRGGGRMAQFSHADFGGMSQWSPGMSTVGDMFNTQLKSRLGALCTDIVARLKSLAVM